MSVSVSIDWDDQVTPKLEQLGIEVDTLKEEVLAEAAQILLDKAQELCPSPTSSMYPTDSTGHLRDSHQIGEITDEYAIVAVVCPRRTLRYGRTLQHKDKRRNCRNCTKL